MWLHSKPMEQGREKERKKKMCAEKKMIEANTMPSMAHMRWLFWWKREHRKQCSIPVHEHRQAARAAAVAAATAAITTPLAHSSILHPRKYFSHTHVSHIFTCLQSSRISRAYLRCHFQQLRRKRNGCDCNYMAVAEYTQSGCCCFCCYWSWQKPLFFFSRFISAWHDV